jgi:hypothetical protein
MLRLLALIAIAGLAFAACGGGSTSELPGGPAAEGDLRGALEGMLHAALNGDADAFAGYLSSSCRNNDDATQGVALLRSLLGGLGAEGEITVEIRDVEYDVADAAHVTVTGLPGLRLVNQDAPDGVATGLSNVSLKLVKEGAAWRLDSCAS